MEGGGVRALAATGMAGEGAPGCHITCCHSSMCQLGGQSNWLHACKACGFSSPHSSAGAGDSPGCRQYTSRVWIPTPQVAEQGPQEPVCHLHQTQQGKSKCPVRPRAMVTQTRFQVLGTSGLHAPRADPRATASPPPDAIKIQKRNV